MRLGVGLVRVVAVVGGEQRRVQLAGDLHELGIDLALLGQTVLLQLDEEGVASEDRLEPRRRVACAVVVAVLELLADEPTETSAGCDQPGAVLLEQIEVDAGLVEEPVEVRMGRDLDQVAVALVGLGQQRQVEDVVVGALRSVEPAAVDEIGLTVVKDEVAYVAVVFLHFEVINGSIDVDLPHLPNRLVHELIVLLGVAEPTVEPNAEREVAGHVSQWCPLLPLSY